MKALVAIFLILVVTVLAVFLVGDSQKLPEQKESLFEEHVYVSWDTMEFDKCVAAWLIVRFIDKDARFCFVPKDTQIKEGIPFDIPGADWSRKHRKCTSQGVLESIDNPDSAIKKIVSIAGKTELNFWQLDRWPEAQKCFYQVKEIMDQNPDPLQCIKKTIPYFDNLYNKFRNDELAGNGV